MEDNHFSLISCQEVNEICAPLFESFGFTHFHFRRTFNDRSRAVLCTNSNWVQYFYQTKKYDAYGIYEDLKPNGDISICESLFSHSHQNTLILERPRFVVWAAIFDQPVFNKIFVDARDFKIDHGITITEYDEDSCTFYQIGTTPNKAHLIHFYLNHYDVLSKFIEYFKCKAAGLIKKAEANRIRSDQIIVSPYYTSPENTSSYSQAQFDYFFEKIDSKQQHLSRTAHQYGLTQREMQSIQFLIKGYTAKQIANAMQLSPRTVEFYLANIKMKLQCYSKAQLIQKLHSLS